ncbi:MAG: SURF1 family protein [Alphaproteobacteria bacterium]|nr:SURF1 family protein [Alphaproteobacteria bacterium]
MNNKQLKRGKTIASSLFVFFLFFILMGLGTWQIQRHTEKKALLESLIQSQNNPRENLDLIQEPELFQPLFAEGHFVLGKTIFLQSKVYHGKSGVYILDVFKTQNGQFLLVQRGWSATQSTLIPSGSWKIEGVARIPSAPTFFQPDNAPPNYFWIDLKALSQDLNLPLLPYYLVLNQSLDPTIFPTDPIPLPRNNHLEYAITWYTLALALIFMLLWSRKQQKEKEKG